MARQDVNFGFTSTGADGLARDFKKVGDTATLAAKGARLCADELRAEERASKTAADALHKAERVAALLAVTEHELDAELDKTNTRLLEQFGAAELAGKGLKGAGKDAGEAGAGFSGLAGAGGIPGGGLGAVIAAGVALSPVLVTVGVGLAGVAAAAVSTVGPILKAGTATKQARDALAGLDPAQRAAYDSLGKLKTQFAGFGKALEPTVLDIFSKGLRVASGLMGDVAPVAKATGDALGVMLGQIDAEFRSRTWQDFFGFMAAQAGPDVRLLAGALLPLLDTLPKLLTDLQPVAVQLLQAAGGAFKLADAAVTLNDKIKNLGSQADRSGGLVGHIADAAKKAVSQMLPGIPAAQQLAKWLGTLGDNSDKVATSTGKAGAAAKEAAPPTAILAANLFVEKTNAAAAGSAVTDLNTAWSAFLGMSTGLETAQLGIIGVMKTLTSQAGKAGASFTGVNDQSVALQTTFESSLVPSVENVIGSMRTAHATTHDLAQVVATDLKPAVDKGALSNTAYKNQLYDLAVQAGYTGPNKLAPLKTWFDKNATSTDTAKAAVDRYAAALGKIPGTVHTTIIAEASGTGTIAITGSGWALGSGNIRFHAAAGAYIRAGTGPTADDVPAMLSRGELVVPARMVSAGAVDHLRGRVPGFSAGGLVGLGGQVSAAPGQAGTIAGGLAGQAMHTGVNQAMAKAHALVAAKAAATAANPFAGITGVPSSGPIGAGAQAAQNYAKSILWAYGWKMDQWPSLQALWMGESGWNYRAYNPNGGATGIPQALPGNKMASAGADWQTNPATQIRWGLGYIKQVYGSPSRAYSLWLGRSPHWYGEGGLVDGYASGGLVGREGAAFLRAWQDRHGGGYGAAWGPIVVNRQIDSANAALTRNTTLAHASLPPAQHRHYVGAAAWWKRHRDALVHERGVMRDWRGQLGGSDHALSSWIAAAGSNRALAPSVRRWKAQRAHQEWEISRISRALGWSAAQQAAIDKARPKPPAPTGVLAKHTYGGDVTDTIGAFLASVAAPFGAARGGLVLDSGGWLKPGFNPVWNKTGRPEHLVPARSGGGDVHLHLTVNGPIGSPQQLEDWFIRTANKTAQHGRLSQAVKAAAR